MKVLKVSTKNPALLKDDINQKIQLNEIRSWDYHEIEDVISHKGEQYKGHFYFEYKIDDDKGILVFIMHSSGNTFAESRAFQLLERMLEAHFSSRIEIMG